ncbi:MAG TPA: universal stress protein [Thermoleophilaceae bacterium]
MATSIVVGTDGSGSADHALDEAISIALRDGAALHIVAAFPDPAVVREQITSSAKTDSVNLSEVADSVLTRAARQAEEKGVRAETHARESDPATAILEVAEAQEADLIVIGSRGLSGIQRFLLGSVSQKVSAHARCNVMIVRD